MASFGFEIVDLLYDSEDAGSNAQVNYRFEIVLFFVFHDSIEDSMLFLPGSGITISNVIRSSPVRFSHISIRKGWICHHTVVKITFKVRNHVFLWLEVKIFSKSDFDMICTWTTCMKHSLSLCKICFRLHNMHVFK